MKCNLRYWMYENKIFSFSEVVRRTGLDYKTLVKLRDEKDLETLNLKTIKVVCDVTGLKLSELIEYDPKEKPPT